MKRNVTISLALVLLSFGCSTTTSTGNDLVDQDTAHRTDVTADGVPADLAVPDSADLTDTAVPPDLKPHDVADLAQPDFLVDQKDDTAIADEFADQLDTVVPNACTDAAGTCMVPLPGMQEDGCALGSQKAALDGCAATEVCCVPIDCYAKGGTYESFDDLCCPGLAPIAQCFLEENGGCMCPNCPCTVCSPCGDGVCDAPDENPCNCPADCFPDPLGECTGLGGSCKGSCQAGEYTIGTSYCAEAGPCCLPFQGDCVGPGGNVGIYPGAPSCCPGLAWPKSRPRARMAMASVSLYWAHRSALPVATEFVSPGGKTNATAPRTVTCPKASVTAHTSPVPKASTASTLTIPAT